MISISGSDEDRFERLADHGGIIDDEDTYFFFCSHSISRSRSLAGNPLRN